MIQGIGLGIGINRSNYAQGIFGAYQSRVIADGGITEGGACVDAVSSLLQSSSLLIIPSGYKGGKAYAEIPTNGNGDLTWTRASDAWRTNIEGLIQRVPWNLVQQSETFDNAIWGKTNGSITANSTTAPNGTATADTYIPNTVNSYHPLVQTIAVTSGTQYTFSIYVKSSGYDYLLINTSVGSASGNVGPLFNLSTGTLIGSLGGNNYGATITSVGNGWYRIVFSYVTNATSTAIDINPLPTSTIATYSGNGTSGIFAWGAQLVEGSSAQTYFPTTDRLNVPRLSYMYGSCPALLLEPQRTNLFQNSGWTGGGATPTGWTSFISGSTTALASIKNLSVTAYRFSGTSQRTFFVNSISVTSGTTYTISFYVESVTTAAEIQQCVSFGSSTSSTYYKNGVAITSLTLVEAGNLYSVTCVAGTTATADMRIGIGTQSNVTANIVISMPQMEQGAYYTTFILSPVGASATRIADSFSRNNIFTNGLITSSGGTWFVELRNNITYLRDTSGNTLFVGDNSTGSNNALTIRNDSPSTAIRFNIVKYIGGVQTGLFSPTTSTVKIAIKWNGSTADVFVNGTKVVSATAFTATALEFLNGNAADVPKFIPQMKLYNQPLSDAECISLTTL
jgi:hypothetical protein